MEEPPLASSVTMYSVKEVIYSVREGGINGGINGGMNGGMNGGTNE